MRFLFLRTSPPLVSLWALAPQSKHEVNDARLVLEFARASAWPWGRDVGGEPCLEAEFRLNRTALKVFCSSSLFSPRSSCSLCWSPIWHSRKYGRRGSPPSPLLSASASEHTRARCGLHARSHERTSVVSPRLRRCFR